MGMADSSFADIFGRMDPQDRLPIAARRLKPLERPKILAGQGFFDGANPLRSLRMAGTRIMAETGGMAEEKRCHANHPNLNEVVCTTFRRIVESTSYRALT